MLTNNREGIATQEQIRQFRREGWTRFPALLDDEALTRVRGALDRAEEESAARIATGQAASYRDDPNYRQILVNLRVSPNDSRDIHVGWDPKVAAAARDLLGVDHVQLWQEGGLVKPPQSAGSRPTAWHQDLPLQPFDRRDTVTLWIATEDIPLEAGPLGFIPGSHRLGPLGQLKWLGNDDIREHLNEDDLDLLGDPVCEPFTAGDATAHGGLVVHGAGENRSDRPRRAWVVTYISSETLYTGLPSASMSGLGLKVKEPFDPDIFPIIV
jgi:ectoine hydroxylase-related dioxygenase (phytanoyl-CoA dioxygenase family)